MKRQIFFAQIGGFDTHSAQIGGQANLLTQVSQAINAFFSGDCRTGNFRTRLRCSPCLTSVAPSNPQARAPRRSAPITPGEIINSSSAARCLVTRFTEPTRRCGSVGQTTPMAVQSPRGRWIPTTSVEQYAATLATWYGLSSADLTAVFPLIGRFSTPNLGFLG